MDREMADICKYFMLHQKTHCITLTQGVWMVCIIVPKIFSMVLFSFCMNYLINGSGKELISLWPCWHVMEAQVSSIAAFSSSPLLGVVSPIFLLIKPIIYIFYGVQIRRVCWPIKHSNPMVIKPGIGTFGSVDRGQVLLENEISISIKLANRRKHEIL